MVHPRVFHVFTLLIGLTLVFGCATSIAHMQTGKVLKSGAIEAGAGLSADRTEHVRASEDLGQAAYDAAKRRTPRDDLGDDEIKASSRRGSALSCSTPLL